MANNADTPAIFSQEAEEAVIGSVLIAPHLFSVIAAQLQADDFFVLRHRYIWEALTRMAGRGEPSDFLTVQEDLKAAGKLADVGGASYLLNLINNTPTSVNAEVYAGLVKRAAVRRQVLRAAEAIKMLATEKKDIATWGSPVVNMWWTQRAKLIKPVVISAITI